MNTKNDEKVKKFTKTPTADSNVISSTEFMTLMSSNPAAIISGICHSYRLTAEFIQRFKYYITPEMFMESPRLSGELIEMYPELFDMEMIEKGIKNPGSIPNEDEDEDTDDDTEQEVVESEDTEKRLNIDLDKLSLYLISKIRECPELADYISTKNIKEAIYDATEKELKDESLMLSFIGINAEIDEILLKAIKDQDIRDSILLTLSLSEDSNLTSTTYKYYSNDMKESILGTDDVDPEKFTSALAQSRDLGWKERMINSALSGDIKFRKTTATFEKDILMFFSMLPRDLVAKFLTLRDYMPNAISYKVMLWVMENKDFTEENYITALSAFKSAGLFFNLKKLAKQNDYKKLEEAMSDK